MSYEVTLTPEAKHDLREIYRYIFTPRRIFLRRGGFFGL